MDESSEKPKLSRRNFLNIAGLSTAAAWFLAACGMEPKEAEKEEISPEVGVVKATAQARLLDPEQMNRDLEEAKAANPQIYDRWVEISPSGPGITGGDKYINRGGGIIFEQKDGFTVILTSAHLFDFENGADAARPVKISQSPTGGDLEMNCKIYGPGNENPYEFIRGGGDLAILIIHNQRDKTLDRLPTAEPEPGMTAFSIGKPTGSEPLAIFSTKTVLPEKPIKTENGRVLIPGAGFSPQASGDPVYTNEGLIGLVYGKDDSEGKNIWVTTVANQAEAIGAEIKKAKND